MLDHEYSLLGGFNRVHIGQILAIGASALSSLLIVSLANKMGIPANIPPAIQKMGSDHARPASDLADAGEPHYGK